MPRDGSGTYTYPPGTRGAPATPIESLKYNNYIDDVAIDLNTPRPISAGGTGGSTVNDTLDNLSAEKFKQVVTNWDTTVWRAGSFYASSAALGIAPVTGHAFAGICYFANATDFVCEATDLTDPVNPVQYIRVMAAGIWGAWVRTGSGNAAANLGEYTFDNTITFPPASGQIRLNNATQNSATEIFISHIGALGGDNTGLVPFIIKNGSDIIIQDKDEGPKYKLFSATADPVLSGGDFRVTVTFKSGGTDLVSAQRMLVGATGSGAVLYTTSQTLTAPQKTTAQTNMAAVAYETQTLTDPQETQARKNIYAAPFDAMAYSGLQINGAMEVSQEFAQGTPSTTERYICDGWTFGVTIPLRSGQLSAYSQALNNFTGLTSQLSINVNTAVPSIGTNDYAVLTQRIEGWRIVRLSFGTVNAQPITLGFMTAHVRTGVYSLVVSNFDGTRTYATTYTQIASGVPEYKTVTIPGCVDGSWNTTNGLGLFVNFAAAAGSNMIAPVSNAWFAGGFYPAAPGQVNSIASTSDIFRLSGVILIPGTDAPPVLRVPFIMRQYEQELVTCQRYFQWLSFSLYFPATGAGQQLMVGYNFPRPMRATPTISPIAIDPAAVFNTNLNVSSNGWQSYSYYSAGQYIISTAAGTAGIVGYRSSADARL